MDSGEGGARGVLGKVADFVKALPLGEPLLVAALPPLRDILFRDGAAFEESVHEESHRRVGVEPNKDVFYGFIFEKAMIQLLRLLPPCGQRSATAHISAPRCAFAGFEWESAIAVTCGHILIADCGLRID